MMLSRGAKRWLLAVAVVFFLLRFVHLDADYPRNIRWDDGIATDEGWYASAAVNEQAWGTRLLPGDMNISVLMPVWPEIVGGAFRVLGFGVVTLRATAVVFFGLDLLLVCWVLRRFGAGAWAALVAALLAVNPWSFAFSRSGFLEFPAVAFFLLAVLAVPKRDAGDEPVGYVRLLGAGVLFVLAVLLKTTAVALFPAFVAAIYAGSEQRVRRAVRSVVVALVGGALIYVPYWALEVRRHRGDVNFYLTVVQNTLRLSPIGFLKDASRPFRYGLGSDHLLFSLALVTIVASICLRRFRGLWRDSLYVLSAVWVIFFLGFMVEHNNDPARYFAMIVPAILLVAVALMRNLEWSGPRARAILLALICVDGAVNAAQVMASVLHPKYSFRDAGAAIGKIVREDASANRVLIADDAHEIVLQNGLKPVNLLFHSATIAQQMERYQPGWWVQFSPIDDGRCFREVLSRAYAAEAKGSWEIFYPGQRLVLWKLTPMAGASLPSELTAQQEAACKPPVY